MSQLCVLALAVRLPDSIATTSRNAPSRLGQMRHCGRTLVEWLVLACEYKLPRAKAECIGWISRSPGEFVSELAPIVTSDEHGDVLAALWPALRPALLLPFSALGGGQMLGHDLQRRRAWG